MTAWTEQQNQVIETRNCDLLVSAAAGSGKTAVLVERIVRMVTDPKEAVDIDRLLVVTFTRAAAGEMKERIRSALEKALKEDPENSRLQRQEALAAHAKITTIDSFCMDVVRNHFHEIDLDPAFRVADEGEIRLIRQDVLDEVMEQAYQEADPDVIRFTRIFAEGKTDAGITDMIERFYNFSIAHPYPASWRRDCLKDGIFADEEELWESSRMKQLLDDAQMVVSDMRERAEKALAVCGEEDGPANYVPVFTSDLILLDTLLACRTYKDYAAALKGGPAWRRAPGGKKKENVNEDKLARVKAVRELVKKSINSLYEDYFAWEPSEALEVCRKSEDMIKALTRLTDRFEEAFSREKRSRGIVDFSDIEHFALQILVRSEEEPEPTETAEEYRRLFREVMVDEYQDSNFVQEMILKAVSKDGAEGRDRFMVGDVKQSIYRFRQARPQLFMDKYARFTKDEGSERVIDLTRNFRSRRGVLDLVNAVFEKIMFKDAGGVDYDENAALRCGASYPETEGEERYEPELILIETKDENGESLIPEGMSAAETEALAAAEQIEKIAGRLPVWDKELGKYRPASYADIVILMRSVSGRGDVFVRTLTDRGIPARVETGTGYFSAPEVRAALSMLSVLDNPHQDFPLYCVLISAMGGFTDEELAVFRASCQEGDLYTAIVNAEVPDFLRKKMDSFLDMIRELRRTVPFTPIHELIRKILDRTGYLNCAGAMSAGPARLANLEMLALLAETYEQSSYRGLFNFVRYIEKLQRYEVDYAEAGTLESGEDTVRIMSIHKSKGLEFPVVIVPGLGRRFNRQDSQSRFVLHPDLGAACDLIDPEKRIRVRSLVRSFISQRIRLEDMGEELRVLYVAMTRAKEKLILCGQITSLKENREKYETLLPDDAERFSRIDLMLTGSFLDLILPVILRRIEEGKDPLVRIRQVSPSSAAEGTDAKMELTPEDFSTVPGQVYDEEIREYLGRIDMEPGKEEELFIPLKVSVSDLKHADMDAQMEDEQFLELYKEALDDPSLMVGIPRPAKEGAPGGAALGTLYHRVMELYDFTSNEPVERQLETMVNCGKIHEDEIGNISPARIAGFLGTDLARQMSAAARRRQLHRETPFVIAVGADEVDPSWPSDRSVLVQGIIDAWYEQDDHFILLDYKTDKIPLGDEQYLARFYRVQMALYKKALERLTGKKASACLLYSFAIEKVIEADL